MKFVFSLFLLNFLSPCFSQIQQTENTSAVSYETFYVDSKILIEKRTINCWIPTEYIKTTDSIPVLYMLDGGIEEDFLHLVATLNELIRDKKIPPMLLIGIENTVRRRDLTGKTTNKKDLQIAPVVGGSEQFRRFIAEELFAEVDKRFPSTTQQRGIIGESLAGLFVTETLLVQPSLFDSYIAFDPSLWWNNHQLVKEADKRLTTESFHSKRFWFASSNAKDIFKYTKQLAEVFQKLEPTKQNWNYISKPSENHGTIFKATKEAALIWMFGK